jgi:hypothetical protein
MVFLVDSKEGFRATERGRMTCCKICGEKTPLVAKGGRVEPTPQSAESLCGGGLVKLACDGEAGRRSTGAPEHQSTRGEG